MLDRAGVARTADQLFRRCSNSGCGAVWGPDIQGIRYLLPISRPPLQKKGDSVHFIYHLLQHIGTTNVPAGGLLAAPDNQEKNSMENFVYTNPTKILFGRGMEDTVGEEVKLHGTKVLLHYGKGSIKKYGLYDKVVASLNKAGVPFIELGGVKPNPVLSLVREGVQLVKENGVDAILAVGGGSVSDSAKAIAFGALYDGDVWDFFLGKKQVDKTLPVGVVLTFPGTGSESSFSSVITNEDGLQKRPVNLDILRPKFAILNPELSFTLSPYQTACGAVDAMTHAMERYFTATRNVDITDRQAEAVLKTLRYYIPIVLEEPENYEARAQIMWASKIAHDNSLGVGRTGDFASHRISHEISAMYDIAHGATLSIIFPAWMRYVYKRHLSRFVQFAVKVWDVDMAFEDEESIALEGIRRMEKFFKEAGLPTRFSDLDVTIDRIEEMADKCAKYAPVGNMNPLYREGILDVYNLAR